MVMKIILAGGGTGGATTPLLAVANEIRLHFEGTAFLFVGTKDGPERALTAVDDIPFQPIFAGKLRRYFSIHNLLDPLRMVIGFFQAWRIISMFKPDIIISVGSFVAVPVVWAGWVRGVPSIIHQQDVDPGLANRLCAPIVKTITVAFEQTVKSFSPAKTRWIGNPIRPALLRGDATRGRERFGLREDLPVLLAFGGGTGALRLNQLIAGAGLSLVKYFQIIHITGGRQDAFQVEHPNYHVFEFLTDEMADAYAVADVVVCRAGLSTLSEIAALAKPAVVIPLPESHQEKNAEFFQSARAAIVIPERRLTSERLLHTLQHLLDHPEDREALQRNIRSLSRLDASQRLVEEILAIVRPMTVDSVAHQLQEKVKQVKTQEPLSHHTHFRLGGPADIFVTCTTREELIAAGTYAYRQRLPTIILGGGANCVFPDLGFRGLVIQVRNAEFSIDGDEVTAGAGMNTGMLASKCLAAGLTGLEFIVGIYGTVGGAVRGNAGSFGREMRDVVRRCTVIDAHGSVRKMPASGLHFQYRGSIAKRETIIIVDVTLRLQRGDVAAARRQILEYTAYKRSHQPLTFPSAGCMFKNHDLRPEETKLRQQFSEVVTRDRIPAWAFIQEAGLAGRRIGDIEISERHANFFINRGRGTAEQVMVLKSLVKQQVRDQFGVQLQEEVQFLGF